MTLAEEKGVRKLRAVIYGECTDGNWLAVRDRWAKPENIQWLKDHQFPLRLTDRRAPKEAPIDNR